MKRFVLLLCVLVALVGLIAIIGSLLPKQHTATRAARFHQPPEAIWSAITDYSKFPEWRKSVRGVEALPPVSGKPSWREFDKYDHSIPYEVVESMPPRASHHANCRSGLALWRDLDIRDHSAGGWQHIATHH